MAEDDKMAGGGPEEEPRITEPLGPPNQRPPADAAKSPEIAEDDLTGFRFDASGMPLGPSDLPVPDVPSPLAARYLFPTEKYRGEWRRHWIHLMPVIVVGVLATFVGGYLIGLLGKGGLETAVTGVLVAYILILVWAAWRVADWYFDRFILTNKRVMVINGIITRKVAMMPLLRVTDMKYEQSPLGRMMNYGSFVMESAGQDQALREVKHLPDPNELYLQICEEMYEPEAVEARDVVDGEPLDGTLGDVQSPAHRVGDA
ncbi:MAG: PH domain-containing protein [Stackebrandtia sp.]